MRLSHLLHWPGNAQLRSSLPPISRSRSILCSQIYEAGIYLASLGREEVQACVSGLRQYGLAYEEAFDRMEDIEAAMAEYSNHTSQRAEQAAVFGGNGTVNGGYVPKHDGPSGGDGMMANYSTRDGAVSVELGK